jgi:hypothetical protein
MIDLKKKNISSSIILLMVLAFNSSLKAQHIEVTPFVGYETGGKVSTNRGYLRVADGMNFGGAISFGLDENTNVEFTYNHMNSELSIDKGEFITNITPVNVDYYMLGGLKTFGENEKLLPFASASFGIVHYGLTDKDYTNKVLGAVNIATGLKFQFSERFGLRLQARLLMPLYYSGIYFTAGSGGAGYGVTSTCVMVQGDFTGALYFVIE